MKTLRNLVVPGGLYRGEGSDPALVFDLITLSLDQEYNPELPASIVGEIVSITKLHGHSKSYDIEYDEADLTGASFLKVEDVLDYLVTTGGDVDAEDLAAETASRIAGDASLSTSVNALNTVVNLKAPLASPVLTGNPTAPTQSASDDSTRLATTAFVKDQNYVPSNITGITGAFQITNIVAISQEDYDDIVTPSATTVYFIV